MDWDPVQDMEDCLTLLPCFLLIYWVDFLADCSSPLSRARLWPSVPVHHCILLIFSKYSTPCAIFIQTLWSDTELSFYLAENVCLFDECIEGLYCKIQCKITNNDIFVYCTNTAVKKNFTAYTHISKTVIVVALILLMIILVIVV